MWSRATPKDRWIIKAQFHMLQNSPLKIIAVITVVITERGDKAANLSPSL